MLKKILVIAPHVDDETLGAGGTLLKLKKQGSEIIWFIVTNKNTKYGYTFKEVKKRNEEIKHVKKMLGFDTVINLGLKPSSLDIFPKARLVFSIEKVISDYTPDTIILPFQNDAHSDHRIVFEAAWATIKVFRQPSIKMVLMMEVPSETNFSLPGISFQPNLFVDISKELSNKLKIFSTYSSEIHDHPFPRSLKALRSYAFLRGSQSGCEAAEGFMILTQKL